MPFNYLKGPFPIMQCRVIKVDHPQFVNRTDGGVKRVVHLHRSGALPAAALAVRFQSVVSESAGDICKKVI